MPSLEESRRHVKAGLENGGNDVDHAAILASLQDEIDRHNAVKDGLRTSIHESMSNRSTATESHATRFRFKSSKDDSHKQRRQYSRDKKHHEPHDRKRRRRDEDAAVSDEEGSHPFPRQSTDPSAPTPDPNEAFRTALFDALADDEGAAYWESVYSQPIHIYPRPTATSLRGELEAMNDEQYANYVKTKMWERKHPEVVQERKVKEKERKLEEEERTRRREDFVRRRERAAWERAQRWKGREEDQDNEAHHFDFAGDNNRAPSETVLEAQEYADAWSEYLSSWEKLKYDLLEERNKPNDEAAKLDPSKRIPWPVLPSKAVIRPNIEAFMRHAPSDQQRSKLTILKAERVRWHPDKIQQRFTGAVDDRTIKLVTGIFQVVDGLLEEVRKRDQGR